MKLTTIYRLCIVVGTLVYVAYWFLRYLYGYLDSETGSLLSYGGFGAVWEGNEAFDQALFGAWIACAFGMYFYRKAFRFAFLFLVIVTAPITLLYGVSVETSVGAFFIDIVNIADGMVLALAFFSPVKDEFY